MTAYRKNVPRLPRLYGLSAAHDGHLSYTQVQLSDPHPALISARVITLGGSTADILIRHTQVEKGSDIVEITAHGVANATELRDLFTDYAATLIEGRDNQDTPSPAVQIESVRVRIAPADTYTQEVIVPGADPTMVLIEDDLDPDGRRRVQITAAGAGTITNLENLITQYGQRISEGIAP